MAEDTNSSVPPPTEVLSLEPTRTEAESKDIDVTMEEPQQGHVGDTAGQADAAEGEVPVIHLAYYS